MPAEPTNAVWRTGSRRSASPSSRPAKRARADRAVLLTPGASATRDHHALVAIDKALSAHGVPVERIDLPSRKGPAANIAVIRDAAAALARRTKLDPGRIIVGGRSFGGRMCSMAVAEGLSAMGLVLVSYPLHPPGKTDILRSGHFPDVAVPCLFVSGTRDAFGTPSELERAGRSIDAPVEFVWLEGGNHGLVGKDTPVADSIARWVLYLGA